ncbi:MAG TPA: sulfoxide reductase heme-binding subunit YedZ [Anaerolineaceae bacterium]|nr:sulfoxide reductase heme-binding subunit YedZ [Anaerolineaceae bacterium]
MNTNVVLPITNSFSSRVLSFPWLRICIHVIGLLPLAELIYKYFMHQLTFNPIQFIEQFFGRAALNLLIITLAVTPVITITGRKKLSKHRRTLGLYTFFLFALHFTTFLAFDYGFDLKQIFQLIIQKPFILLGSLAGLMLLSLAATSFKYWMKRLGKTWARLHKMIYVIGGLAVLHYALAVKGSLSTLSGNIVRPLVMSGLVIILLVLRIPPVKKRIISLRKWVLELVLKTSIQSTGK